jgi:hypothetical protein
MKTRFETKEQAKAHAEANDGVFYHGHRSWVSETPPFPGKYQAGDKVEDEKSKVLIGDGTPIW